MLEVNEDTALSLSIRILKRQLRDEASSLISVAFKSKSSREGRWHSMEGPGFNQVRMVCYPIIAATGEDHMLVAMQTRIESELAMPIESLSDQERTQYILQIETEMQSTRETLQQTVEELQTSNEELQSVNEELQSTNEEMQATNEELETSNEELQSTNEELITVNEEMQVNAAELQTVSTELSAVLLASPNPVLVIDHALIIRRASESALAFFDIEDLPPTGIHLSQCTLRPSFPSVTSIAVQVFKERRKRVIRVVEEDRVNNVVFSPFNDSSGGLLGLTISVFDYDAQATSSTVEAMENMAGIGAWRYEASDRTVSISPEIRRTLGIQHSTQGLTLDELEEILHPKDRKMVKDKLNSAVRKNRSFYFEARAVTPSRRVLHVQVTGKFIHDADGNLICVVGAFRDATSSLTSSMALENLERLRASTNIGLFSHDVENDTIFYTGDALNVLGIDLVEQKRTLSSFVGRFQKAVQSDLNQSLQRLIDKGGSIEMDLKLAGIRGKKANCSLQVMTRQRLDGTVSHLYGSIQRVSG